MKRFTYFTVICLMALSVTSCRDDFMSDVFIGEGEASISATLDFKPMSSALTRSAGDALKDIGSLYVLLYDADGTLKEIWDKNKLENYTVSEADRTDADADNGYKAESRTKRATFTLPDEINFGQYYMYAVANIPDLPEKYKENIQTVDGLKSLPLTWNSNDISQNGQMIGCFANTTVSQDDGGMLTVNTKGVKLHAWLRRAASKVTVAYDGSQLKEGVFVYLQSVQIKDIPMQCYLVKENNVGGEGYDLKVTPDDTSFETDETGSGTTMPDGESITYHTGDKPDDFEYGEACADHRITVGSPHFGSHDETAPALYFYENMQGAGENMPDKRQDADGNGELDRPGLPKPGYDKYELKDSVKYGTYIEVHAHYVSNTSERLGNGRIIYRFMLGQDVIKDYNTKRNCHYKLTLKFKNFANEADWHIEYEEPEPGVMVPEPYYISYLYNHSMMLPVKVNTGGYEIKSMKAEIIENAWAPHNPGDFDYYKVADNPKAYPWHGFLSLHKTEKIILEDKDGTNEQQYKKPPHRGLRTYTDFRIPEKDISAEYTTEGSLGDDKYRVEKHPTEATTYNIFLPMYTRAKQMIPSTGYTGNNPYVAYQRKAVVEITTKLSNGQTFTNEVPIYQVRRIVNPKGIYRSGKNSSTFHVELMRLPGEDATEFVTFQSEGPWKAYIVVDDNNDIGGIHLSEGHGSVLSNDTIHGKTGSVIDFDVNFSLGNGKNRYAIIRVEYHNYTCQHLIFVRQGNDPDNLIDGGAKWYAENMTTKTKKAETPLDEGSLFRRGNWDQPIDALNNKNPRTPWINVKAEDFELFPDDGFTVAGKPEAGRVLWKDITSQTNGAITEPELPTDARVASFDDYNTLKTSPEIGQGYGILYGDDATECAKHIDDSYGYDYQNMDKGRGMRGCFVYNKTTGKSLFFPIGASGYGQRKEVTKIQWGGETDKVSGILRYSAARYDYIIEPAEPGKRPLFYDLFRRPGGLYWLEDEKTIQENGKNKICSGWDINYFTFDFNHVDRYSLGDNKNACFIRCVKK